MQNVKYLILLVLITGLMSVISCSGNDVTQPDLNPDRLLTGNGQDDPGGPNGPGGPFGPGEPNGPNGPQGEMDPNEQSGQLGPFGPYGPLPDFEIDCERTFEADFSFTLPCGLEMDATGTILIQDNDCSADESDVLITFSVELEDYDHPAFERTVVGAKTQTDEGVLYSGYRTRSNSGQYHSFEMYDEFELLVYLVNDEPPALIEGTYHRNRTDTWSNPNNDQEDRIRDWYVEMAGVEI